MKNKIMNFLKQKKLNIFILKWMNQNYILNKIRKSKLHLSLLLNIKPNYITKPQQIITFIYIYITRVKS